MHEISLSMLSHDALVLDLRWNPAIPGMLCSITSDCSVGVFQIKNDGRNSMEVMALSKVDDLAPLCAAWSPKGKQIVVGCRNGSIVQLKPDLKVARTLPGPTTHVGEVVTILWISNYQFCTAYYNPAERRFSVLIVDAPKGAAQANFTNFEDITYGMSSTDNILLARYMAQYVIKNFTFEIFSL